jgi:hypothetical protein
MGGSIYLLQDNETLVEMQEKEPENEDLLQRLLSQYPHLLAGDQINSEAPRRWLLIKREAGIPAEEGAADRWAVDHLFLDQDGIPTLVEVKRSTDTRLRREVVGQMLDYAANALAYWPAERIQAQFEAWHGDDAETVLAEFLNPESEVREFDPAAFWQQVKTNLQAGRIRLIFAADKIPTELRRIVEFLNTQMNPAEVLGLELKQYAGQGLTTLVPNVIGQKEKDRPGGDARQWDEPSFFKELQLRRGPHDTAVARKLLAWAHSHNLRIFWGKGKRSGSFFPLLDREGITYWLFSVWTYGTLEIQFQMMHQKSPFDQEEKRLDLRARLNQIPGVAIARESITKRPSVSLSVLRPEAHLEQFLRTFDWVIQEIKLCHG